MSLNCSIGQLEQLSTVTTDFVDADMIDNRTIWLEQDFTSLFASKFWESFLIAIPIILMIIILSSFIIACIEYPRKDMKQKQIKLHSMVPIPIFKTDIMSYLNPHTNGAQDINNLILQYADITYIDGDINTIITSTMSKKSLIYHFMIYILIGTLLIAMYIPWHVPAAHLYDSYVSYLKTECISYKIDSGDESDDSEDVYKTMVVMDRLCMEHTLSDIDNYVFYVRSFELYYNDNMKSDCYIHKDDLTVRIDIEYSCCTRCGKGFKRCYKKSGGCNCCNCCNCCDCCNCCGYYCCIEIGLLFGLFLFLFCRSKREMDWHGDYHVYIKRKRL